MLNHIVLMGRLTRDPEVKRTANGISVASFTLAVDRDFKAENGERETDFVDIVAWRSTADFVQRYFSKGRMAVVSGRLQIRPWTDREGNKRRSTEVVADNVYFGDSKPSEATSNNPGGYAGSYNQSGGYNNYGAGAYNSGASYAPPASPAPAAPAQNYEVIDEDDGDLPF